MSDKTKPQTLFGLSADEVKRYSKKYPELAAAAKLAEDDGDIAELFRRDLYETGSLDAFLTDEGNPIVQSEDPDNPFTGNLDEPVVENDFPGFEVITFPDAPPAHPHLVFVYGSLLRGNHNNGRLKDDIFFRDGFTKPEYTLYSLGPFPGMVEHGSVSVRGELFWLSKESLRHLDMMEGHPNFYERTLIQLLDGTFAWTYIYQMGAHGISNPPVVESGYWRDHFSSRPEIALKLDTARKAAKVAARRSRFGSWQGIRREFSQTGRLYDSQGHEFRYTGDGGRIYKGQRGYGEAALTPYTSDDLKARLDSFSEGTIYYDEDALPSTGTEQLRLLGKLSAEVPKRSEATGREKRRMHRKAARKEKQILKKLRREIKSGRVPQNWQNEILRWADKVSTVEDAPLGDWGKVSK